MILLREGTFTKVQRPITNYDTNTTTFAFEFAHPLFTDFLVDKINHGDSVFEQCSHLSVATLDLDCRNIEACC